MLGNLCKSFVIGPLTRVAARTMHVSKRFFSSQLVYLETYGCQMNFNDAEIVLGILDKAGWSRTLEPGNASLVLLLTCAIREGAEAKIWQRIDHFRALRRNTQQQLTLGVLGCMAQRIKDRLLTRKAKVDLVCGPDAYRNLPSLIEAARSQNLTADVLLGLEETYADIAPVRLDPTSKSAFVSIMRGCNNMCSFCIVPFVRGRERSRPVLSIMREIQDLASQQVKEITLLGQNVNSYRGPTTELEEEHFPVALNDIPHDLGKQMTEGFRSICKRRELSTEISFTVLLDIVSRQFPEIRFRFTSPHPKDFPPELLTLIKERPNLCKSIHLPVQSGATTVLERMRRGYSRDAYLSLVDRIYAELPGVAITSDFIVGFCGETRAEHEESLEIMRYVGYDMAYMFAYSMRPGTHAHRTMQDDVPEPEKQSRLREMLDLFYGLQNQRSQKYIGTVQRVLVANDSSKKNKQMCMGKADNGRTCVFEPPPGKAVHELQGEFIDVQVTQIQGGTLICKTMDSLSELQNNMGICYGH